MNVQDRSLLALPLCIAASVLMLCHGKEAAAQDRSRLEILDSLAHPATAGGGESMVFDTRHIVTGKIGEEDTPPVFSFRWRNDSGNPLSVLMVTTTCGCAVPEYDRKPVSPGDTSSIRIVYHPKGRPGHFSRRIFVYTGLSSRLPSAVLELSGEVVPSSRPVWNYSCSAGPLLMKRKEVTVPGNVVATERIECFNAGEKPLQLSVEKGLLPECISFSCEPRIILPGETGDIVIHFDPSSVNGRLPDRLPLVMTGLDGVSPMERTLYVNFQ